MRHLDTRWSQQADPSDMLGKAVLLPNQCWDAWDMGLSWKVSSRAATRKQLLVLGMGGSAIGADLMNGFIGGSLRRAVHVNRTYTLPGWVDQKTLAVACSYSGNTEETLAGAAEALRRGAMVLAMTSGGKLAQWARTNRLPLLQIPSGLPPRSAVGYMTFAPLGLLTRMKWLPSGEVPVRRICRELKQFIETSLSPSVDINQNPAKKIALVLRGKLPVLYGASGGWEGITFRWRTQLEENSKTVAFHQLFPEAAHNEISGWVQPKALMKKIAAVFVLDPAVHPRVVRRMKFVEHIVRSQGVSVVIARVPGSELSSRMMKLVSLGDFMSIYLAFLYGIDPTPVERVEALKRYMKK